MRRVAVRIRNVAAGDVVARRQALPAERREPYGRIPVAIVIALDLRLWLHSPQDAVSLRTGAVISDDAGDGEVLQLRSLVGELEKLVIGLAAQRNTICRGERERVNDDLQLARLGCATAVAATHWLLLQVSREKRTGGEVSPYHHASANRACLILPTSMGCG